MNDDSGSWSHKILIDIEADEPLGDIIYNGNTLRTSNNCHFDIDGKGEVLFITTDCDICPHETMCDFSYHRGKCPNKKCTICGFELE